MNTQLGTSKARGFFLSLGIASLVATVLVVAVGVVMATQTEQVQEFGSLSILIFILGGILALMSTLCLLQARRLSRNK